MGNETVISSKIYSDRQVVPWTYNPDTNYAVRCLTQSRHRRSCYISLSSFSMLVPLRIESRLQQRP